MKQTFKNHDTILELMNQIQNHEPISKIMNQIQKPSAIFLEFKNSSTKCNDIRGDNR
jgi:hypothetical protein